MTHTCHMGLLDRFRRRSASSTAGPVDVDHLRAFAQSRQGVEAYVEPRTTVTGVTVLLVAADGEWTRRPVPSLSWVQSFGRKHDLPVYDAAVTGTPARVREFNRRRKQADLRQLDEL